MSSTSMKPTSVAPALTITINSTTSITFNPITAEVTPGGVVSFASGNSSAWEIELWNRQNDDPHPLRLYVPPSGESAMVADPMSVPRDVKFNVMTYPSGTGGPVLSGGTYTIKIVGGVGGPKPK